jgi:hypothetical protein
MDISISQVAVAYPCSCFTQISSKLKVMLDCESKCELDFVRYRFEEVFGPIKMVKVSDVDTQNCVFFTFR